MILAVGISVQGKHAIGERDRRQKSSAFELLDGGHRRATRGRADRGAYG
jgi:hypothetical protein